jgi:MFS family permease
VLAGFVAGAVLLPIVWYRSGHHPEPLFQRELLRIRSVWSSCATTALTSAVGMGIWATWPLLLTQSLGYTTIQTGLLLTPVPVVMALAAIVGGRVISRVGPRTVVVAGVVSWIIGLSLLVATAGDDPRYVTDLLPGFLVCGAGYGLTMGPLQGLALRDVHHDVFGQVNAIILTVRFVGSALGVAIAIGMIGNAVPPPLSGFDRMHVCFLVVSVVALGVTSFLPRRGSTPSLTDAERDEAELIGEIEAREGI